MSATGLAMDIEERLEQAIENDVDYADPGLTRLLKDALQEIKRLNGKRFKAKE